mgnify:CR=1 FL=1
MKERLRHFLKRHQAGVLIVIFVLLMIIILFGTQIVLFVNFLLGNDIVVKLSANQESIKLVHGKEGKVRFDSSVITNPFCSADCVSEFKDLGKETVLAQEDFSLNAGITKEQEYVISPSLVGVGYNLYQFRLQCHSVESWLCQTNEKPTTRNILITVFTNLTDEEEQFKEELRKELSLDVNHFEIIASEIKRYEKLLIQLNQSLIVNSLFQKIDDFKREIEDDKKILMLVQERWDKQQYFNARQALTGLNVDERKLKVESIYGSIQELLNQEEELRSELKSTGQLLENITTFSFDNNNVVLKLASGMFTICAFTIIPVKSSSSRTSFFIVINLYNIVMFSKF